MEEALRGHNADYVEVRLEESASTRLAYLGGKLEDIGRTSARGGNARACVRGGWGYVTFNDLEDLRERVALAVRQARLVGREQTVLSPVEPVVAVVPLQVKKDPTEVSISAKRALL